MTGTTVKELRCTAYSVGVIGKGYITVPNVVALEVEAGCLVLTAADGFSSVWAPGQWTSAMPVPVAASKVHLHVFEAQPAEHHPAYSWSRENGGGFIE